MSLHETLTQANEDAKECGCVACDRLVVMAEALLELHRLGSFPAKLEMEVAFKLEKTQHP